MSSTTRQDRIIHVSNKQNNNNNDKQQQAQAQAPTKYHAWIARNINTAPIEKVHHVINLLVELTHIESEITTTHNTLQHHTRVLVSLSQRRASMSIFHIMDKHEVDTALRKTHADIEHYTVCLQHANAHRQHIKQTLDVVTNTIRKG